MKNKLALADLKIKSFVTGSDLNAYTVKAGGPPPHSESCGHDYCGGGGTGSGNGGGRSANPNPRFTHVPCTLGDDHCRRC